MSRLTPDQIKAGILHDDLAVRSAALQYFSDSESPDLSIMPLAIEALEKFGREEAFRQVFSIVKLVQSEATIRWAVDEWKSQPPSSEFASDLAELFCAADPRMLLPFEREILVKSEVWSFKRDNFVRRLKYLTFDDERLWRELKAVSGVVDESVDDELSSWDEALDLADELGRRGPRFVDEMMTILKQDSKHHTDNPLNWMQTLCAKLAGDLRYEPTLPLLVAKLHFDDEFLHEECQTALIKIGGDRGIDALRREYADADTHFQFTATGVLHGVHTDQTVPILLELLANDPGGEMRSWLLRALVGQFSTEANEAVHKALFAGPKIPDVRDNLVAACTLMGQEFPELDKWRQERRRAEEIHERKFSSAKTMPPAPRLEIPAHTAPRIQEPKTGRNDPCPCGSGKKFKHCCIKKSAAI